MCVHGTGLIKSLTNVLLLALLDKKTIQWLTFRLKIFSWAIMSSHSSFDWNVFVRISSTHVRILFTVGLTGYFTADVCSAAFSKSSFINIFSILRSIFRFFFVYSPIKRAMIEFFQRRWKKWSSLRQSYCIFQRWFQRNGARIGGKWRSTPRSKATPTPFAN